MAEIKYDGLPGLPEIIADMAKDIIQIWDGKNESRYPEAILLNYSFIEQMLKLSLFFKITMNYAQREATSGKRIPEDDIHGKFGDHMKSYCNRIQLFQAQNIALAEGIIDFPLFEKIDKNRINRNNIVHNFWLYNQRKNMKEMRDELSSTIDITTELGAIVLQMAKEIGIPEILEIDFFFSARKRHIASARQEIHAE